MTRVREITVQPRDFATMQAVIGESAVTFAADTGEQLRTRLRGAAIWNVNSTSVGGGVAEMLGPLIAFARGAGIDTRWVVIEGSPEFFKITKRLHHALHGSAGDGSALGSEQRSVYESVLEANALELLGRVRSGDLALLHDPQTLGLAPYLIRAGVRVIWRCHIGTEDSCRNTEQAWSFLEPYLEGVERFVFSRSAYVPARCDPEKTVVIQPSIDALSSKNQELSAQVTRSILAWVGIRADGHPTPDTLGFLRQDGTPARVEHKADLIRMGGAPSCDVPLVVQVSRWDPLKDPIGVMRGFVKASERLGTHAELVLAGPTVHSVADDPEADDVFLSVLREWRTLPHAMRDRVTLACLPMHDPEENAAIVNALQRDASVIVQKSLKEGFGLTVTEAMWKGRAVLASRVGGIQDQIEHERTGLLLDRPGDVDEFARALARLLTDDTLRKNLGEAAREAVRSRFLGNRHLLDYARLFLEMLSD